MYRHLYLLFFLFFFAEISSAQDSLAIKPAQEIQYDTDTHANPLELDEKLLEDYKDDKDFNYEETIENEGWWKKFTNWLAELWYKFWDWIIPDHAGSGFWTFMIRSLPYIIVVFLVLFIIWLFWKLNPGARLLKSKETPKVFFTEEEEIIRKKDIQKLIDKALLEKDYRLAVRYYYLLILKKLTDAEVIEYEFDKTNSDYFSEITSEKMNTGFRKVTNLYDYIWYGNFKVTEDDFKKAQNTFNELEFNIPKAIE